MIGEKLREVRQSQGRSLAEVAAKASISVATLSRIETEKQSIDVQLLLLLTGVLGIATSGMFSDGTGHSNGGSLAKQIVALDPRQRGELWRQVAIERRAQRATVRRGPQKIAEQIEELLEQLEVMREELEAIRARVRAR